MYCYLTTDIPVIKKTSQEARVIPKGNNIHVISINKEFTLIRFENEFYKVPSNTLHCR